MEDNFNKHLGNKLKLRRLALGLTQTKVAKAINVTFQQIQKYEKGTNGVSSIRLLQLSNYLKVPINYFFEDFSEYLLNLEKSKEGHMNVNYNFLVKVYSELTQDQKIKFGKPSYDKIKQFLDLHDKNVFLEKEAKINSIFEFKKKISNHIAKSFCVAVSGGADSMALSFLAKCYSLENNKKIYRKFKKIKINCY